MAVAGTTNRAGGDVAGRVAAGGAEGAGADQMGDDGHVWGGQVQQRLARLAAARDQGVRAGGRRLCALLAARCWQGLVRSLHLTEASQAWDELQRGPAALLLPTAYSAPTLPAAADGPVIGTAAATTPTTTVTTVTAATITTTAAPTTFSSTPAAAPVATNITSAAATTTSAASTTLPASASHTTATPAASTTTLTTDHDSYGFDAARDIRAHQGSAHAQDGSPGTVPRPTHIFPSPARVGLRQPVARAPSTGAALSPGASLPPSPPPSSLAHTQALLRLRHQLGLLGSGLAAGLADQGTAAATTPAITVTTISAATTTTAAVTPTLFSAPAAASTASSAHHAGRGSGQEEGLDQGLPPSSSLTHNQALQRLRQSLMGLQAGLGTQGLPAYHTNVSGRGGGQELGRLSGLEAGLSSQDVSAHHTHASERGSGQDGGGDQGLYANHTHVSGRGGGDEEGWDQGLPAWLRECQNEDCARDRTWLREQNITLMQEIGVCKAELAHVQYSQDHMTDLVEEVQRAQSQAEWAASDVERKLRYWRAEPSALVDCGPEELSDLVTQLETALGRARAAHAQAASHQDNLCPVCWEERKGMVFQCGHQTCATCGDKLGICPICRKPVTLRIRTY